MLTVIKTTETDDPVWGKKKETLMTTPRNGVVTLVQHKSGYSVSWTTDIYGTYDKRPYTEDQFKKIKKQRAMIEKQIAFKYGLICYKGVGTLLADIVFAYKKYDNDYSRSPYSKIQLQRMAARAIVLLGQLPSAAENIPREKALAMANDYYVTLPNSGWVELLQEFCAE